jgi:hypothetical protein
MRVRSPLCAALAVALAAAPAAPAAAQVTAGQVDDFTGPSADGWFFGGGPVGVPVTPAAVVATGGPAGAGDAYMRLTATGLEGPGGRLTILNAAQWGGNYTAAGVGAIAMDVRNAGNTALSLRVFLEVIGAMGPTDIAYSTSPVTLAAGGNWTRVVFPLVGGLTSAPFPGSSVADALGGATVLRLAHSPNPLAEGGPVPAVAAELWVDNVTAVAVVPEPSALLLLATGVAATLAVRGVSRRRG